MITHHYKNKLSYEWVKDKDSLRWTTFGVSGHTMVVRSIEVPPEQRSENDFTYSAVLFDHDQEVVVADVFHILNNALLWCEAEDARLFSKHLHDEVFDREEV